MLIHPELKSELRQLGLDENTVPDAETWKKLLATIGSVYDQRDSAQTCFNALFEQNNDAIFLLNLEGKHLLVNQQASEMLGYKHNEIIGLSVQDMVVEREHHLSEKVRQTLAAGKKMPIYERTFRHKNGHEIPTEVNVDLVRDSEGRPLYIQSVVRNITQASRPLSAELTIESPRPQPTCSSGCGSSSRCTAAHMMPADTPTMRMPSKPEEKYSALWWP